MRTADVYTIEHESISSISLMERAAVAFVDVFEKEYPRRDQTISVFCGQGNNGGDGLAIARLLSADNYQHVTVYLIKFGVKESDDYVANLARIAQTKVKIISIFEPSDLKEISADIMIDAVLGAGLNKPLAGEYEALASLLNDLKKPVVSVDVPTGFPSEGVIDENYNGVKCCLAICFQRPKINFFFPESTLALDRFAVVDIGLDEYFIENQPSNWSLNTGSSIKSILKRRKNFTHKGTYGHALIVAGNTNTMGAALLAARGCLRVGAGLTTVCLPQGGLNALNVTLPEVMALPSSEDLVFDTAKYAAIAIGPGLGIAKQTENILAKVLDLKQPIVLDADALTLLSNRSDLLDQLPEQSILTPHLKEFDRLFGEHHSWWSRVDTARNQAVKRKLIIVLKNQYTFICMPEGKIYINQTGNPSMASGGMGDVLTGMITGFLAQSYSAEDAAKLAVYVHGKAGDELAKTRFVVSASQVAEQIPKTLKRII
jgi:NAD(P)H-hydrate epimerase